MLDFAVIIGFLALGFVCWDQQRHIRDLVERIHAGNYAEYKESKWVENQPPKTEEPDVWEDLTPYD